MVGLTADHGVAMIPERARAEGIDAGRLRTTAITAAVGEALRQALGVSDYKIRLQGTDLHLESAVAERVRTTPLAADTVVRALRAVPGVGTAFFAADLETKAAAGDRDARAALASHRPGRSGDFVVFPKPNWFFVPDEQVPVPGDGTSHGLPYAYDQHVPVVLYGKGIVPGEYLRAVTPADIAPTFAFLCGITLARADGDVLVEALTRSGRRP